MVFLNIILIIGLLLFSVFNFEKNIYSIALSISPIILLFGFLTVLSWSNLYRSEGWYKKLCVFMMFVLAIFIITGYYDFIKFLLTFS